ncbi:MAG: hypothetical protein K1X57_06865 [Gemmataceae bacterium]|nr:hypothetical protein [Gemmataceae bacterium]
MDNDVLLPEYHEIAPSLDCGDVLLFAGVSRFSLAIRLVTNSHWSHAALVARARPGSPLLLWEATLDTDLPDVVTQEVSPGVNLYDLEHWLRHYAGETAIRRLNVERTDEMRSALLNFYNEARGRPYSRNRLELLRAVWDGKRATENLTEDSSSYFCSELVAEAYQRMGLLPAAPLANEYVPRDFSTQRREPLPLLLGASLEPEVWVCRGRDGSRAKPSIDESEPG